ncbi:MAG: Sapep family Mn(2+)-dependent dipeptidase, partial [Firmicutes bacterium]|nr:Sapep family Mn(2+)-dependent dipeptidase [Bacillota bacterium]
MNDFVLDAERLDRLIEASWPDLEKDLLALVSCPSVEGEPAPGAPFGAGVARALDCALDICRRLGFEARDVDGYCGIADLKGAEAAQVGVLAHLDVVPARAEEWDTPPFDPQVKDDVIYGRGVIDDKGPLLAALYGLKALTELGFRPRKTVRVFMGCNEETHMACMDHYLSRFDPPECGFTPDASWPLIVGEKGVLHYSLEKSWQPEETAGPALLSLTCGVAPNVEPSKAEALLRCVQLPDVLPPDISCEDAEGDILVRAQGTAAHGSTPYEGDNALMKLLRFLDTLDFGPAPARDFIAACSRLNRDDCFGADMGVAGEDARSQVTHAPTMCRVEEGRARLTCDMRFLLSRKTGDYLPILRQKAAENGLTLADWNGAEPLWLGEDHPLAGVLLDSYRQV